MPNYDFSCPKGHIFEKFASMKDVPDTLPCHCGLKAERLMSLNVAITGTRDSFGIGKKFYHTFDDGTVKEITTHKEWEKAGYKDALSCHKGEVRERIKEKMKKIQKKPITVRGI